MNIAICPRTGGILLGLALLLAGLFLSATRAMGGELIGIDNFGSNPGTIDMYTYVPDRVHPGAALVVSLHGCNQDATTYSENGWRDVAEEWNSVVIYPEQRKSNNPLRCWNWFRAEDAQRGRGEAKSIRQMIDAALQRYPINKDHIYIEGLSAGGWMAAVMLACYPDVFAGGATIAGGPAFCAVTHRHFWDVFGMWNTFQSTVQTNRCMDGLDREASRWRHLVESKGFSGYSGKWPRISIWHGSGDNRVHPEMQHELLEQWTSLHGIDTVAESSEKLGPGMKATRKGFQNEQGAVLVETFRIEGMGHGLPIADKPSSDCGTESEYIIEAGICAVRHIGRFWGLNR